MTKPSAVNQCDEMRRDLRHRIGHDMADFRHELGVLEPSIHHYGVAAV